MSQPSVVAIMLTKDREAMTRQAVESFKAQSHPKKRLLVYDTSEHAPDPYPAFDAANVLYFHAGPRTSTIGDLRNEAIEFAQMAACPAEFDIVCHFDSDDLSHPNRIAEQVALLQSSGADVVGFNELLFWREGQRKATFRSGEWNEPGQAWLYSNPDQRYPPGSSLAFWRHVWERKPFEATSAGEDLKFCTGLKVVSISSRVEGFQPTEAEYFAHTSPPRMLCRIHSGNTSTAYNPKSMEAEARKRNGMWKRVPEWDSYCAAEFAR